MSDNSQDLECLAGIRVVDFTQFEAGPSCTEALAWLGAEVVKIENPKTGDPARRVLPGKTPDDPWYFHMFNANKKSLTIDLKSPRGLAIKEMLKKADVTAENMAPGTIERLGLGYDEVKKLNPRHHLLLDPGVRHREQVRKGTRLRHDRASRRRNDQRHRRDRSAAGQARPELRRHRHRDADGDHDSGRAVRAPADRKGAAAAGRDAGRDAALHAHLLRGSGAHREGGGTTRGKTVMGSNAPSGLYQCKPYGSNDWIYVMTSRANPEHWARLMKLFGREELIDDPRYATGAARIEREAEVDAIVTAWTRQHTKEDAMTLISGVGVPAGAVFDTMELQNDPSFEKRGIMQVMEHPSGPFKMPTWPVRVDGRPPRIKPSPLLGQHSAEVLNAWLGLGADDIATLKGEGVL